MKRIIIKFEELNELVKEMEANNTKFVELHLMGTAIEHDALLPAFVHFQGMDEENKVTDYESIDGVQMVSLGV